MSDTPDPKETALIPTGSTALITRSSALVKRGLETLASLQVRVVHFPPDRSMGSLELYDRTGRLALYDPGTRSFYGPELGQACGDIVVPTGKKLYLYIIKPIFDLSPLSLLMPDDVQGLFLSEDKVLDKDYLAHINHLRFLEELWLHDCGQITDAGLAHVGELTGLKFLFLSLAHLTGAGLVYLKNLTELETLNLLSCGSISNAGLAHVGALKNLRQLNLNGTQINGAGLSYLHQLSLLTSLDVSGTNVSDVAITSLQEALPNCRVVGREN